MAQGYLHIRDYANALREFEKVDKEPSHKQKNNYFDSEHLENSYLYWPGGEKLFAAYVGYPSVLQYAETLLNLQRSWEAKKRLPEESATLPEPATAYQRARRHILLERIENDRSPANPDADWTKDGVETENLALQRLAVDSERALSNCQFSIEAVQTDKPSDPTHAIEALLLEFRRATEKLRSRMEQATKNRSEIDAACLSWADGLSVCKELLSFVLSMDAAGNCRDQALKVVHDYFHLRTDELFFRDVAAGLCIDPGYRDHAVEVRKTLIKNLSSIHDLSDREVMPSGFSDLFEQIATHLKVLLDKLIQKPPRFASQIEIRDWHELRTVLPGDSSDEGDRLSVPHKELREFVSYGFVYPTEDDVSVDAAQRKTEPKAWKECPTNYRCVKSGEPAECAVPVLAKNPSFSSAENGSKTLHHLDRLVQKNRKEIDERLYTQQKHDRGWHFVVLQRWNSFTPAMRASEGGGYFLFHAGKYDSSKNVPGFIDVGVVIDPGYGFVKNFVSEGFGVLDITAIVITHDHPDHLADVGSLVNLLVEVRKNRGGVHRKTPKVEMLLSRGAFEQLNPLIESARDVFRDTVVLEPGIKYDVWRRDGPSALSLQACRALHRDASDLSYREGFDSVGIIGEIRDDSESVRRVGIPSDTKWDKEISQEFTGQSHCDLICLHLGSIIPEEFPLISYFDAKKTSVKVLHEKQQLYLPGVVWYLEAIREHRGVPTMVILSEFGEELAGGVRIDIARRLQAYTDEKSEGKVKVVVLPGDVGLRVDPIGRSIRCSCCHLEHPWTTPFHCETSGSSEQIFYVCPWCLRNFTQQERAEIFSDHRSPLYRKSNLDGQRSSYTG